MNYMNLDPWEYSHLLAEFRANRRLNRAIERSRRMRPGVLDRIRACRGPEKAKKILDRALVTHTNASFDTRRKWYKALAEKQRGSK